ncbi:GAF domain-containing protein [Variovorax sp. J22R133]|uniref:GAF domain-containing protein n=1 Tax=Variovorax brevis TaxID=3053503 RepID=UPI002575CE3B|nr:GAF domain-containing protein [Variovorax sp. J22R133]MDM0117563.1 GAF domain-containing protein [Variovorax sp. J22R133]
MGYQEGFYETEAVDVKVSEVLVATPDGSDYLIDPAVPEVLKALRTSLHMDVAFVAEFVDGHRVYRRVDADDNAKVIHEGHGDPLERTYCKKVVEGLLPGMLQDAATHPVAAALSAPFPIGAFLSAPIVLNDGSVYGTMCCFSFASNENLTERDLHRLETASKLIGRRIDEFRKHETDRAIQDWKLEPIEVLHH